MKTLLEYPAEIILLLFVVITFLQSGLDKVFDWNGNLSWLKGHFKESPFKNMVAFLLGTITLFELAAGILSAIGLIQLLLNNSKTMAFYGSLTGCLALLMLLFGQRMAKDYAGAQTIVIYLIPSVFLLFLLQP